MVIASICVSEDDSPKSLQVEVPNVYARAIICQHSEQVGFARNKKQLMRASVT